MNSTLTNFINTNFASVISEPFHGHNITTQIDVDTANLNLRDCYNILLSENIPSLLIFGTLLGIYRDNSLIPYDTDIDVAIQGESVDKLIRAIPKFIESGFRIIRYDPDRILSIHRNGVYLDIYLYNWNGSEYVLITGTVLARSDFESPSKISYLGTEYNTVCNPIRFFENYYGRDWRTPIKNLPATIQNKNR